MGLISKIISSKELEQKPQLTNELSKDELELLLKILGNADVKGREVEFFYTLALKLQNQYILKQQ